MNERTIEILNDQIAMARAIDAPRVGVEVDTLDQLVREATSVGAGLAALAKFTLWNAGCLRPMDGDEHGRMLAALRELAKGCP